MGRAMQDLNDLYYFSMVVEKGGFAAAGRALDIPKSRLSRRIAQLEDRLGVRLLQRSTRRFAVTEVGQKFYRHCQSVMAEAQAAEEAVAELSTEPRGVVRISMPISFTQNVMKDILPAFAEKFPLVRLQILSTNRRVDLINEGVDIALRVRFKLDTDGDLILRTFGRSRLFLVASPAYLAAHGHPDHPEDLSRFDTLSSGEQETQSWELSGPDGQMQRIEIHPRLMCADFPMMVHAAVSGLGIALLPESVCVKALAAGELEVLLKEWTLPEGIAHCVFPSRRGVLPAVRALIDYLAEKLPVAIQNTVVGI
jgi:DNA-binding transcriptional LysR family regulator